MKEMRRILLFEFWLTIAISLTLVVLYESEVLLPGDFSNNAAAEYYAAIAMELITICLIPLSLRLLKFKAVSRQIARGGLQGFRLWALVRLSMLSIPMTINCWLYYQFLNTAFGYMGIIGLLSLTFIYPSKARCEQEIQA